MTFVPMCSCIRCGCRGWWAWGVSLEDPAGREGLNQDGESEIKTTGLEVHLPQVWPINLFVQHWQCLLAIYFWVSKLGLTIPIHRFHEGTERTQQTKRTKVKRKKEHVRKLWDLNIITSSVLVEYQYNGLNQWLSKLHSMQVLPFGANSPLALSPAPPHLCCSQTNLQRALKCSLYFPISAFAMFLPWEMLFPHPHVH